MGRVKLPSKAQLARLPDLFAAATVLGALLQALVGPWAWPLSSVLHFYECSALVWLAGIAVSAFAKRLVWSAAHLALLGVWIALHSQPLSRSQNLSAPRADGELRVVTFNVADGLAGPEELCEALAALDADLVLLQELNHAQAAALEAHGDALAPYRELRPAGRRGKGVLSRFALRELRHVVEPDGATRLHGVVETPAGELAFVNLHARATVAFLGPLTEFDEQVSELARTAPRDMPVLIAGDFNVGPRSALLAPLERVGFESAFARCGAGLGLSFPNFGRYRGLPTPPLVRIDHVFTRGLDVRSAQFGAGAGSDHRPLIVSVALEEPGPRTP